MKVILTVTEGPHRGRAFEFLEHDTFIVGRSRDAHFRLPVKDKTISRFHFLVEVNPPSCRLLDMASTNGTSVNGRFVPSANLAHGDVIVGGMTTISVAIEAGESPESPDDSILTRVEVSPPTRAFETPVTFAPPGYRIGRELGRGGMGVVHLGYGRGDDSPVAIKTIIPSVTGSPDALTRFLREAGILRQLDHPNIVRFLEVGFSDGHFFFAMEFVPGVDADTLMRGLGGPLPIDRAVGLTCQALEGLAYAHSLGFVHRDIKPSNLVVASEGGRDVAKLADFGLARTYQASPMSGLSISGQFGGTSGFLAPEQITNFRAAKPTSDLYAAGAMLYHMLTGSRPYNFPSNIERQLLMILQDDPVPIRSRRPEISEGLALAIHKALERDPANRFADAGEMQNALVPFLGRRGRSE